MVMEIIHAVLMISIVTLSAFASVTTWFYLKLRFRLDERQPLDPTDMTRMIV